MNAPGGAPASGAGDFVPEAYEAKHLEVLSAATTLFARKGFHKTSVRELARATDRSLSGLYYYFSSKEELLFQIQHHCYGTLLKSVRTALQQASTPEEELVTYISHHLGYFRRNMDEMKVLAHEDLTLTGEYGKRLLDLKRRYSEVLVNIVNRLAAESSSTTSAPPEEMAAFILFGMMNWLYTWPRKLRSRPAEEIAETVARIFLGGYPGTPQAAMSAVRGNIAGTEGRFWDGSTTPPRSES
jgi:AcrR family transcriptional regulator